MLRQLWNELKASVAAIFEKRGWTEKSRRVQGVAGEYAGSVYSGYRGSPRNLKIWMMVALIVTVLAVIYGGIFLITSNPADARLFFLPVPVDGYKVEVAKVSQIVGASGTVLQYSTVDVMSRVAADVTKVPVNIGDLITSNTELIETDQSAYIPAEEAAEQAELASRTTVEKDGAVLEGTKKVKAEGLASDVEVQEAITSLATAKQAEATAMEKLASSKQDLAFTRLKSPLPGNGIVLTRTVNPGDRLAVGSVTIFTLGTLDRVYFVAQVQEEMSAVVNPTAPAEVVFSSFPSQTFHGTVEKIDPTVNDKTRTFPVYIVIDNPKLLLKPGVTGFARINLERMALAVPDSAVMNLYGENASVFVINSENKAVLTPVRLGLHGHDSYEVLSGLKEGDVVVTAGTAYLKENETVHANFVPNRY